MSKEEIVKKLVEFVNERQVINTECEVIYLVVELRKLLERIEELNRESFHPIIKFYADWAVHTNKKRKIPEIIEIINKIDSSIPNNWREPEVKFYITAYHLEFVSFRSLREEIITLFRRLQYDETKFHDDVFWKSFCCSLTKILIDQPIINPTPSVKKFLFRNINRGCVDWCIEFNDSRGEFGVIAPLFSEHETVDR